MRNCSWMLFVCTFSILASSRALAQDPPGLSLLRPDSLVGWEYGAEPLAGWSVTEGVLQAQPGATPLLSGWSFGDFTLRLQWSVSEGASIQVLLPSVPDGPGLAVLLAESPQCGRVTVGRSCTPSENADGVHLRPTEELAAGVLVERKAEGRHTATVERGGAALRVTVDGRLLSEVPINPAERFGLGLAAAGEAALSAPGVEEPAGESLFPGADFAGFWTPGDLTAWERRDGSLVWVHKGGNYLRTEKAYGNFTFSCECKIASGGNSGLGIRTPREGWPSGDGMELQIYDRPLDEPTDVHSNLAIYGNVPPLARADRRDDWNRIVVKADGPMISAWVNGQLVQQANTAGHPELKFRNPEGWIGFQDHGGEIEFRNVTILEAPAGPGLAAWRQGRMESAGSLMIDRLMNSERLARADGVGAGAVACGVAADGGAERVLAELTGPGAIVSIARSGDEGRIAFYFDGEEQPRIECAPGALRRFVPPLSEDANPILTALAYARSVKVVLRDAPSARYRIEYATLPSDVAVETYSGREAGFPRGWLGALEYRIQQHGWGVHREHSPLMEVESPERVTLPPGERRVLLQAEGAGIAQWIKLRAPKQLLENDDLWLELSVDGEATPAVAAPARFWFPGLVGQGNYPNTVLIDRGGPALRLAAPFAGGLTLSAVNRGTGVLEGIAASTVIEPSTPEALTGRMRLRGTYQPADDGEDLVACEGAGRLVGLVCEEAEAAPCAIESLAIDGQPAVGWSGATFDELLGRAGDHRSAQGGRRGRLVWRYFLLAPPEFSQSLRGKSASTPPAARLSLYYGK